MNRTLGFWILVLIAPVMWFINLEANFAVGAWVCQWRSRLVPALIAVASLAVAGATGWFAWWRAYSSNPPARTGLVLLTGGAVLSSLFFIVILAQTVPILFLDGCQ